MFLLKLTLLLATTKALKILVAGDQHTDFFDYLASSISKHHSAVRFSRLIDPIFKFKKEDEVIYYGIGKHPEKFREI
jgi:hypothetical protein